MTDIIRWGIIGTGSIAHQFARGLSSLPDARLVAVASRSKQSADKFGDEFSVPQRHAAYAELAENGEVDAVYIATPHPFHKENTLQCLAGNKAVLCEKPFALAGPLLIRHSILSFVIPTADLALTRTSLGERAPLLWYPFWPPPPVVAPLLYPIISKKS